MSQLVYLFQGDYPTQPIPQVVAEPPTDLIPIWAGKPPLTVVPEPRDASVTESFDYVWWVGIAAIVVVLSVLIAWAALQ